MGKSNSTTKSPETIDVTPNETQAPGEVLVLTAEEENDIEKIVDDVIEKTLVKENITEKAIKDMEDEYLQLTLTDVKDKKQYSIISANRKKVKSFRVLVKHICKKGREKAIKEQKRWLKKENNLVPRIENVENHLETEEDKFTAEEERVKEAARKVVSDRYILRAKELREMGAISDGRSWILDDVSFLEDVIRESDDETYLRDIHSKYKILFDKKESDRLEAERLKKEEDDKRAEDQRILEFQRAELEKEKARLKEQQEAIDKANREAKAKEDAKFMEELKARTTQRLDQLANLGLTYNPREDAYLLSDINIPMVDVKTVSVDYWDSMIADIAPVIEDRKKEIEKENEEAKRLEDERIQQQHNSQIRTGLLLEIGYLCHHPAPENIGSMTIEEWHDFYLPAKDKMDKLKEEQLREKLAKEAEDNRIKEEELLAKQKDSVKWDGIIKQLDALNIPEMKSPAYRKKVEMLNEKIEEIKAL